MIHYSNDIMALRKDWDTLLDFLNHSILTIYQESSGKRAIPCLIYNCTNAFTMREKVFGAKMVKAIELVAPLESMSLRKRKTVMISWFKLSRPGTRSFIQGTISDRFPADMLVASRLLMPKSKLVISTMSFT